MGTSRNWGQKFVLVCLNFYWFCIWYLWITISIAFMSYIKQKSIGNYTLWFILLNLFLFLIWFDLIQVTHTYPHEFYFNFVFEFGIQFDLLAIGANNTLIKNGMNFSKTKTKPKRKTREYQWWYFLHIFNAIDVWIWGESTVLNSF